MLTQWASIVLFHPQRNAAMMERMIAVAPSDDTVLLPSILFTFGLTVQACVHQLDTTNGTGFAFDIPAPHSDRIPFFQCENVLRFCVRVEFAAGTIVIFGHFTVLRIEIHTVRFKLAIDDLFATLQLTNKRLITAHTFVH